MNITVLLFYRSSNGKRSFSPELLTSIHSKSFETPDVPPTVPVHRTSPKVHRKTEDNGILPPSLPPKKKQSEMVDYFEVSVSLPPVCCNV